MNRRLRKWLLVRTLLIGLVLFGTLKYVGDFSGRHSAVLAAIGALVFRLLLTLQKPPFVPYHVFVEPKMRSILTDFELVEGTEEEWAALGSKVEKLPQARWNIWKSGFSASFITSNLIYMNGWNSFASKLDMDASLEPVGGVFSRDWIESGYRLLAGGPAAQEAWEREGGESFRAFCPCQ